MIAWNRIEGFDWDDGNLTKNAVKHSVSQQEAQEIFSNEPLIIVADAAHSGSEQRFHALGKTNANRLLFAAFTLRRGGSLIRPISVRDMKAKERQRYAEET
jgi:uncharacterized DUF497 family protein